MNCSEVRELLHPLVDGELSGELQRTTRHHVRQCAGCQNKLTNLQRLRAGIRDLPHPAVPPHLPSVITASLPANDDKQDRAVKRWDRRVFLVPSHVLAMVLGGFIFSVLLSPYWKSDISADDVLSAHIRSLMDRQIIQVASADTHTVAPWFAGKVEFAPTVPDLSGDGFILLGGRIDYIKSQKYAALAYRRRKHTINLFVSLRPESKPQSSAIKQWAQRGYNAVEWSNRDFTYTAISDLSFAELIQFTALARRAMH